MGEGHDGMIKIGDLVKFDSEFDHGDLIYLVTEVRPCKLAKGTTGNCQICHKTNLFVFPPRNHLPGNEGPWCDYAFHIVLRAQNIA